MSSSLLIDLALIAFWIIGYLIGVDKITLIFSIVLMNFISDAFKKEKERIKNENNIDESLL